MKAYINRIIENSFIDGPGSRMAVFFQGCNMACLYCHNPETQRYCSACGQCVQVCPKNALTVDRGRIKYNIKACVSCDRCINACPNFSSPKYCEMDIDEVYKKVMDNRDFLDGITLSGGECTLQYEFVYELFTRIKQSSNLTCFIDTNGYIDADVLKKLIEVTDGFMFDLKAFSNERHICLTGCDRSIIIKNIIEVSNSRLLYEIRTVLIEGFTDDIEEIRKAAYFIRDLNSYTRYKLIPFRPAGVKTYMAGLGAFSDQRYEELHHEVRALLGEKAVRYQA